MKTFWIILFLLISSTPFNSCFALQPDEILLIANCSDPASLELAGYFLSLPYLSWQMVLIGDPLYRPFRHSI